MVPPPLVIGLTVCDYVLVEAGTNKVSLIGSFRELPLDRFPGTAPPFHVYAALTDALGEATIEIAISRIDTEEVVYSQSRSVTFADRLAVFDAIFQVRYCTFP